MEKLYASKVFLKMAGGKNDAYYSSYPPESAPGHKLQKPSKESGIVQSLGTTDLVLFTKKQSQKGKGMAQYYPPPKYAPVLKHA